ncbi:MAG: hypothetical protein HQM16_09465 [Deltaproteobacteria bacterium]|nr:hypothetical protein [Deltaproteobacteria bacterium]
MTPKTLFTMPCQSLWLISLFWIMIPLVTAASSAPSVHPPLEQHATQAKAIGTARMETDGTIVLQLRAEGVAGALGDAIFRYPPSHPEYKKLLKHVGGLKPGEEKPVPPWPE